MVGILPRIRELILRYGWNSTCYQLVNPGLRYWLSKYEEAFVGYVEYARTRIVAGAPVCEYAKLKEVVDEFEADSSSHGLRVCYFASEEHLESVIARNPGYATLLLGAQPVWKPEALVRIMRKKRSLRTQLHRAWNKGVEVEEWSAEQGTSNPALRKVLLEWLSTRGLPSLHFLVEPETLANLEDRRIFVATKQHQVVGFLNLSPVPTRKGWLVEQFVRGHHAPNGTVELMLHAAAERVAEDGFEYLTLGLSPLILPPSIPPQPGGHFPPLIPPLAGGQQGGGNFIRFLLRWARAHGKRFYDFEGLEFFKSKFEPEHWEPIYAISNESHFSLRSLYAIACAFTNGHPVRTVVAGMGKALAQEMQWSISQK